MNPTPSTEKGRFRLFIDGELTIRNAVAARDDLLHALAANEEIDVDLAGVSEFDSAGVQLLLAAHKSAAAAHKVLRLERPSEAIVEVLDFLGLREILADAGATGDTP